MTEYQQADTLFTGTDVPFAGPGSASPAAADGGSDYTAWQWEVVLTTVLGIPIPGRAEVTGQPWLTTGQNGQGGAGLHLIWSASWDTKPNSGSTSLQAYLHPDVYTAGGAWDQFLNAPSGPMSEAASQSYGGLPLDPRTFASASVAVAGVSSMLASASQQFADLRRHATADNSGFRGDMADVVSQVLGGLGSTAQSLHDQMTEPTSYSQSVGAAGDAGTAFLASLESAYNGWLAVAEHSPLGAIVAVLKQLATQDSGGSWVISNPQQTPYGDLTTVAAWTAVEQQAKQLWTGALTGDSDFAGLDALARSALSNLVSQYESTTGAIVPVLGPAPPSAKPNRVGIKNGHGGNGGGNGGGGNGGGGPGGTGPGGVGPGSGPGGGTEKNFVVTLGPGAGGGGNGPGGGGNGPGGAGNGPAGGQNLAANVTLGSGSGPGGGAALPNVTSGIGLLGAAALAGSAGSGSGSGGQGDGLGEVAAAALPGGIADGLDTGQVMAGLSGPIGAVAKPRSRVSPQVSALTASDGALPIGVIGLPDVSDGSRRRRRRKTADAGHEPPVHIPVVPEAGTAIGRTASGAQLIRQAAVASKTPPTLRSGSLNTELEPAPAVATPAVGGQVSQVAGGSVVTGDQGNPIGPAGVSTIGPDGEPMMLMPGMGAGRGRREQERQRLAYLPQDEEYWGTGQGGAAAGIGAKDISEPPEQDFESNPAVAGIGAENSVRTGRRVRPDRRNP